MHILLITHHYEPEIGAPQRRWSALIERWQEAGHRVTVFCPPPHYPDRVSTRSQRGSKNRALRRETGRHGETLVRMPYILHGFSSYSRTLDQLVTAGCTATYAAVDGLIRQLTGCGYSLVISTIPGLPSLFAGCTLAKLLGIPHIAEMRDAWPDIVTGTPEPRRGPRSVGQLAKNTLYRAVTAAQRSADAVVTTTEQFAQLLRTRGVGTVTAIPNGADAGEFDELVPLTPDLHRDRADAELRVQYLGTVGRSQSLTVLLRALEIVRTRAPHLSIRARIVGSGAQLSQLKAAAADKNLPLDFLPPVSRGALPATYRWADVALVSLKDNGPFHWTVPSKIFELLAIRRRVIALVEGDAADIVRASGVGTVLAAEDARGLADELQRLAENPRLLCVGSSGVQLLRTSYSYGLMSDRYLRLIDRIAGEGRGTAGRALGVAR